MNIDQIQAVAELFSRHGLTRLEISEGNLSIKLEKSAAPAVAAAPVKAASVAASTEDTPSSNLVCECYTEVKAPLVGVFYAAPSPEAAPFVTIGSRVKKGDVLCILEAMKLMNEIVAETDGEVADICMKNGDLAEYGQVLFKLV